MKKCKKDYDFTGLAYEITGDALYLINGGKEIGNSYAEQAQASPGDTVTDSKGVTHELTQGDINWAKQKIAGQDNTSQTTGNAEAANNAGGNHNSENQNQDRDLRVTPANYQDPATDARGYYSTGANYTESYGSDNDYGMAVIPFKDRRSKLFSHGKSAGKVITDWNEYADKVNLEKEEYMKKHLYDGFDIGEKESNSVYDKLLASATKHLGENYFNSNSCDEWDAKVLTDADVSPDDYFLGNTSEMVIDHINDLLLSKKDYQSVTNESAYVVFMGDGRASYTKDEEHAGLLFTGENGEVSFFHSSKNSPGSLSIVEYYPDISAFERDFAYNTFYYQEIK